jgi:peptidyl-tRNA hydrolase, PTH1 family
MLLIAALGNPGPQYARQRHNVGFMVADEWRRRHGWGSLRKRFHGLADDGQAVGERVALILPQAFMNRSGAAVHEAAHFYRVDVADVLVVHDEVELAFGDVRLKQGGGLGGHNGLRSVEQYLGSRDFWRVRVGVGKETRPRQQLADYVLSDFSEPRDDVEALIGRAADSIDEWLRAGGRPGGQPSAPPGQSGG